MPWLCTFHTEVYLSKKPAASEHETSGYELLEVKLPPSTALHTAALGTGSPTRVEVFFVEQRVLGGATAGSHFADQPHERK